MRRLPYFDFQKSPPPGVWPNCCRGGFAGRDRKTTRSTTPVLFPGVDRPLAQLSVIVEGKQLLLRQGDGLVDPHGQLRFDFRAMSESAADDPPPPDKMGEIICCRPGMARRLGRFAPRDAVAGRRAGRHRTVGSGRRTVPRLHGRRRPTAEACFRLADCSIAVAICQLGRDATTWRSSWMRITSKPGRLGLRAG